MMKLQCLFVVALFVSTSISYVYSNDTIHESNSLGNISLNVPTLSSTFVHEDRSHVKRSQRNANILYRYCRQSGEARPFCLKYAVRMIFATGH